MKLWPVARAYIDTHLQLKVGAAAQDVRARRRLVNAVRQAYRDVPFYRRRFDEAGVSIDQFRGPEDLHRLPFLSKTDVQANFPGDIVAGGTQLDRCVHSATTGSSGKATNFVFSEDTYGHYLACSLRELSMVGYRPWHKLVYIKYSAVPQPSTALGPLFRTAHVPSMVPVEEHIARLRAERPDVLIGYASLIYEVARRASDEDLRHIRPKLISLNSEMSTQAQRELISKRFKCPVYDEYSCEETWMIAAQCRNHNYHIFTDNVWVEFVGPDGKEVAPGEIGEIVITGLRSPVMPFIRYRIGDLGRRSKDLCSCGIGFPLLESFEGRADDAFILSNGGRVPSLKLLNTFTTFIKSDLGLMDEFKLVQTDLGKATVLLVKGKSYRAERIEALCERLQAIIPEPVEFTVELVERVNDPGTVKHKAIESKVDPARVAALTELESA